jgi:PKD repeat protein
MSLLALVSPPRADALILPPDPFDATDRYALLFPTDDGTITHIQARLQVPVGPGELIAEVRYQHGMAATGFPAQHLAVSRPISLESLGPGGQALVTFDFSDDPLPPSAHHRTLSIRKVEPDDIEWQVLTEYPGERLLLRPAGTVVQTDLAAAQTAEAGHLLVGPLTVVRERGMPQTETIRFDVPDPHGVFWLRLTNGDTEGLGRVAAAVVTLNGQAIFRPAEFNRRVAGLTRQLTVQAGENVLAVTVRSEPGAHLTLEVVREDARVCRALGPHTFVRATGKPVTEEITFPLAPQLSGPFTVHVRNGDGSGGYRVDSGIITLNGQAIVTAADFNEQVAEVSRSVTLQALNTLRVKLSGAPGDRLTLEITGFDNVPPYVTITSLSPGAIVTAGPITVTGTVDDPAATVTVNGILATVAADGTFVAEGVLLQDGENLITVVATDSCGNQGEASLTVRLDTAPVGPELIFCAERFREQIPHPPGAECLDRALGHSNGFVTGLTDESAVSITINGVLLPDGVLVEEQGDVFFGMREGTFFWAFVNIPPPDGEHLYTAVVTNAAGQQRTATVRFWRDTVAPVVVITSPANDAAINTSSLTITGTVDDQEATSVRLNSATRFPVVDGHFTVIAPLLPFDGVSVFSITAQDLSGNIGLATVRIIRDRTPPALTVTTPADGAAVNAPTVTVAGTVVDRTFGVSVTAAVNGQPPTSLTSIGFNYSGTAMLAQGTNTLEVVAMDEAGNVSRVSRSVLLDVVSPTVQITAPSAGALLTGLVTVTADATDDASGLATVRLLVDGQVQSTRTSAPYTFALPTVQFPPGSHTLTVQATDRAGNGAEASLAVEIQPQIQVQITSPANGSTVTQLPILVRGTVVNNLPEVGVTVNGALAQVQDGLFAVSEIPLDAGTNLLRATATDGAGLTASASMIVTFIPGVPSQAPVALTSSHNNLAPATAIFNVGIKSDIPIVSYRMDFDGDGIVDYISSTFLNVPHVYSNAGLYLPTLMIIDEQGGSFSATTILNVFDPIVMDNLLQTKWKDMKAALTRMDVANALTYLTEGARPKYEQLFNQFGVYLPGVVSSFTELQLIRIGGDVAAYLTIKLENGQEKAYFVYFVLDANGIWRLQAF